jgi:hypothetical protein
VVARPAAIGARTPASLRRYQAVGA